MSSTDHAASCEGSRTKNKMIKTKIERFYNKNQVIIEGGGVTIVLSNLLEVTF
jgi:hypothetical protein